MLPRSLWKQNNLAPVWAGVVPVELGLFVTCVCVCLCASIWGREDHKSQLTWLRFKLCQTLFTATALILPNMPLLLLIKKCLKCVFFIDKTYNKKHVNM